MNVSNATLKDLIEGQKQFRVPIWQRQYTWKRDSHMQLWRDLLEQYDHMVDCVGTRSTHFLGSFVLAPVDPTASGVSSFLVIDGQQRMTTLMLALCAIRDVAAERGRDAVEEYDALYLVNQFKQGMARFRLMPTQEDRDAFFACIKREGAGAGTDAISDAYRFFRRRLEALDADRDALDLEVLTRVVVERLAIVEITTEPGSTGAGRAFCPVHDEE